MNNFTDRPPIVIWLNRYIVKWLNNRQGVKKLATLQTVHGKVRLVVPAWF